MSENEIVKQENLEENDIDEKIKTFDEDFLLIRNNYKSLISKAQSTLEKMQDLILELDEPSKYSYFFEAILKTAELNEKLSKHNHAYEKSDRIKEAIKKSKKNDSKGGFNVSQQQIYKMFEKLGKGIDLGSQIVDITPETKPIQEERKTFSINRSNNKVVEIVEEKDD